ncbi:MAG: hypothetical protein K9M80_00275 [Candidatus Marinimicrobia bacterium]|nr:hypothetical protein [Candidatus Neomarinimicrobiota bacterium]
MIEDKEIIYNKIKKKLNNLRYRLAGYAFFKHFLYLIFATLLVGFVLLTLEGFLYLPPTVKTIVAKSFIFLGGLSLLTIIIEYILIITNNLSRYSDQKLADYVGDHFEEIGDSLLNAIQLWNTKQSQFSQDLIVENVKETYNKVKDLDFRQIVSIDQFAGVLKLLTGELLLISVILLPFRTYYLNAAKRISHPDKKFEVPLPFTIQNLSDQNNILGGDTVRFEFKCQGNYPHQLQLGLRYEDYKKIETVPIDSNGYGTFTLQNVRRNFKYEAFVENHSIFIPWDRISSNIDSIIVTDRPEIIAIQSRIEYPEYTGKEEKVQDTKKTEYFALPGSEITFTLQSNKELEQGAIIIDDSTNIAMNISDHTAVGSFQIDGNHAFHFKIYDPNGVSNIKPISYNITTIPDKYPRLNVLSPSGDIKLDESMNIPITAQIGDDFGISKLNIQFKIHRKYDQNKNQYKYQAMDYDPKTNSLQEVFYDWDLNAYNLSPEDKIQFKIIVADNDRIKGPKKTKSKLFTALFPSLNDLYSDVKNEQQGIYKEGQEIISQLKSTKEVIEKAHRKLLKNRKISWEQKQQIKEEMKKTGKLEKKMEEISNKIEKVIKKAQKNNLFDKETLQKYMQLQETFQEIMSPELKKAMQDLQKAVDQMNPNKTKKALEKFQVSRDDFEKEIDRQMELFKKIKAEQAMDELVKRIEDVTKRQEEMSKKLDTVSSDQTNRLAKQESDIQNDTEIAEDIMRRTTKDMENIPLMPHEKMQSILDQMEKQDITGQMKQIQQNLQNKQRQQAQNKSQQTEQQLKQFQQQLQQMRENYKKNSMQAIAQEFHKVIKNSLNLAKKQEDLNQKIKQTPAHSSRLMDVAVEQDRLRSNLNNLLQQMNELSKQTMGLSSKIGQVMGQSYNNMNQSIRAMEDRDTRQAAKNGQGALRSLNMGSKIMLSSLQNLQSSGSSTGFENYMKRLQQMAQQQQKLNQQTQQMQGSGSQPSLFGQGQSGLQQLAARQQQIRKSLEELQKQSQGQAQGSGKSLEGAGKDMEKVIEDLRNNKILQKTLDRQNRILTRMLDAQKSLRTQGYKKKRKSTSAEDQEYTGPATLPSDLGEKENYLRQRLEEALSNNYSHEYEELIRLYFEELSNNNNQKETTE